MNDRFPFTSFPTGWFAVAYSADLPTEAIQPVHYFGRELVLFRTKSGTPHLIDAFCPHLGAHLGYGGEVHGERIRCPFHGWFFDGSGSCVEIPYAKRIPAKARIPAWPTCERNGLILAYYDPAGGAPTYQVPVVEEFGSEEWTAPRTLFWKMRSHNQEICENVADSAHLKFVHGVQTVPRLGTFTAEGAMLRFDLHCDGLDSRILLCGLGILRVRNHTDFGLGMGEFQHVMYITPIDSEYLEIRQLLTVKKVRGEDLTRRLEDAWEKAVYEGVKQDVPIFENKAYQSRPILCEEDGPILAYRRWAKQFYPEDQAPEAD
jgi:phenylpropionate dioxygenase-like ring-hydroxylating dioxygenase large terminal subunit